MPRPPRTRIPRCRPRREWCGTRTPLGRRKSSRVIDFRPRCREPLVEKAYGIEGRHRSLPVRCRSGCCPRGSDPTRRPRETPVCAPGFIQPRWNCGPESPHRSAKASFLLKNSGGRTKRPSVHTLRERVPQARHTGRSGEKGWLWKTVDRERFRRIVSGNCESIA